MKGIMMSVFAIMATLYVCGMMFSMGNCSSSDNHLVQQSSVRGRQKMARRMIKTCGTWVRQMCAPILKRCLRTVWGGRKRRSITEDNESQNLRRVKRWVPRWRIRVRANCYTCRFCW